MSHDKERRKTVPSGWILLPFNLAILLAAVGAIVWRVATDGPRSPHALFVVVPCVLAIVTAIVLLKGLFTLQPNQAAVLMLFGKYVGTVEDSGFHWANPFYTGRKISLRSRNFDGEKLKVNDQRGNPIEISAVVVWRVRDTFKATFEIDDYIHFVRVQSESALRQLAGDYPYDHGDEDDDKDHRGVTLRGGTEEINTALRRQVQERLSKAGVEVEEARLNHLAYAPEIASAMLRRQQAEAIISARKKIVHGAVSMVRMAIEDLSEQKVIELDDERKAAMVSNLLVVLCGETDAQPVINAGTLYS